MIAKPPWQLLWSRAIDGPCLRPFCFSLWLFNFFLDPSFVLCDSSRHRLLSEAKIAGTKTPGTHTSTCANFSHPFILRPPLDALYASQIYPPATSTTNSCFYLRAIKSQDSRRASSNNASGIRMLKKECRDHLVQNSPTFFPPHPV